MAIGDIVAGNKIIASQLLAAILPVWADYDPAWTTSGSAPSLGDGTLEGRFSQFGDLVTFNFELIIGSTTNTGTGEYRFGVPLAAAHPEMAVGAAFLYDDGTVGNRRSGIVRFLNSTTLLVYGETGEVDEVDPFIWATGDRLRASITYEPA